MWSKSICRIWREQVLALAVAHSAACAILPSCPTEDRRPQQLGETERGAPKYEVEEARKWEVELDRIRVGDSVDRVVDILGEPTEDRGDCLFYAQEFHIGKNESKWIIAYVQVDRGIVVEVRRFDFAGGYSVG
jgi:hypothetical protein